MDEFDSSRIVFADLLIERNCKSYRVTFDPLFIVPWVYMILREINGRKKGTLLISPRSQNRVALNVSILQRCKSVYRVFESTRICPYSWMWNVSFPRFEVSGLCDLQSVTRNDVCEWNEEAERTTGCSPANDASESAFLYDARIVEEKGSYVHRVTRTS